MAFTVGLEKENIFSKLKAMSPAKRLSTFRASQSDGQASPFSRLTPAQFAELFPDYYKQGLPDVAGFRKALSKGTSGKEATYGPHGEASTANVATGEKVTNTVRAKEIYDYIRSKGVDHNHAVGIVNNLKYESNFNSGAIGDGGTSGGLFQHHASRFSAMKNYVGDGWQTNWKKQVDFALTEGEMKTYLGKNYANGKDASIGFTTHFEKPANTDSTAMYRAGTADGYSSAMEGKGGEPAGGQTPGGNYEVTKNGFVVPRDKSLYDDRNEQQCATLAKGFNPDVGRSSSWTVVPGEIKPGVTVATMRYNLPGGDRTGSGYHAGVAMTAPDADGNFLLLEQFSGKQPQVRKVNANSYGGGAMGGTTQFGLIQSNGRLHDEQSMEALKYGAGLADEESRTKINTNLEAIAKGGTTGPETGAGSVTVNQQPDNAAGTPGPQTNLQQQESVKSIQTATIGDMMRFAGNMAGFFSQGEGLGDGSATVSNADNLQFAAGADASFEKNSEILIRRLMKDFSINATQAAGIVGNLASESNVKGQPLTAGGQEQNLKRGRGGLGWGQWTGERRKDFEKFATQYGKDKNIKDATKDPEANYQFLKQELSTSQKNVIDRIKGAKTIEEATYQGLTFEKPGWSLNTTVTGTGKHKHKHTSLKSFDEVSAITSEHGGHWRDRMKFAKESLGIYDVAQKAREQQFAQQKPAAEPKPTQTAKATSVADTIKSFNPYQAPAEAKQAPATPTKEVFDRMRQMSKPTPAPAIKPELPPGIYTAPSDLDKSMLSPEPMYKEKHSFNMQQGPVDAPQRPVVIDKFLERSNPQFSSPSLERAMKNASNPDAANSDHFGSSGIKLG